MYEKMVNYKNLQKNIKDQYVKTARYLWPRMVWELKDKDGNVTSAVMLSIRNTTPSDDHIRTLAQCFFCKVRTQDDTYIAKQNIVQGSQP